MKKGLLVAIATLMATGIAQAYSLKCEVDARPVDGDYESVELVKNENDKFDVIYGLKTAGFGVPVFEGEVKIASNLSCTFAKEQVALASCFKSSSEEQEKTNSGLTTHLVIKVGVDHKGEAAATQTLDFKVHSPLLAANPETQGWPYRERPGWYEVSFDVKNCKLAQ